MYPIAPRNDGDVPWRFCGDLVLEAELECRRITVPVPSFAECSAFSGLLLFQMTDSLTISTTKRFKDAHLVREPVSSQFITISTDTAFRM